VGAMLLADELDEAELAALDEPVKGLIAEAIVISCR
jgi:hypothetical protein